MSAYKNPYQSSAPSQPPSYTRAALDVIYGEALARDFLSLITAADGDLLAILDDVCRLRGNIARGFVSAIKKEVRAGHG